MTSCVLDSSAALAWVLPGERDAACDDLLERVAAFGAAVPALWFLEIANVLLISERRGRITQAERYQALDTLADLPIQPDPHGVAYAWRATLELAAAHRLTVYDACYLELAVRLGLPLATRDHAVRHAAVQTGVTLALA